MFTIFRNLVKRSLAAILRRARSIYRALPLSYRARFVIRNFIKRHAPRILWIAIGQSNDVADSPSWVMPRPRPRPEPNRKISPSDIYFSPEPHPVVSIILPVHRAGENALRCLKSISDHVASVAYEVIVICDPSPGASAESLQSVQGLRLLTSPQHEDFVRACNRGAGEAKGKYIGFLSDDAEVTDHWLDALVRTFDEIPGTGLVGSKLVRPDGTLHEAGGIIWRDASAQSFGRGQDATLPVYNYAREIDYCSRTSMMIEKSLFEALGGFDEHYGSTSCEDMDLALKVRGQGYGVIYQPCSVVVRHQGTSPDTEPVQAKGLYDHWQTTLADHQVPGENIDEAKDRGFGRRVLILDRSTPTPDQDAGSVTAVNIMYLLRSMGFQITFIPEDNFLYMPDYTVPLQSTGIEMLYHPHCHSVEEHLAEHGERYDIVLVFRVGVAEGHLTDVRRHAPGAKIIFLPTDLHHIRMQREADLEGSTEKLKAAREVKKSELHAIRAADATVVLSKYEQDELRREAPEAKVYLGPLIFDMPQGRPVAPFDHRRDIAFVGGYTHVPNIDAVEYFVRDIMPLMRSRLPGVRLHIVGSNMPDKLKKLAAEDIIATGFVEDLSAFLDGIRVMVCPLRYGAGVKGKIGSAMSVGLPVVSTFVGVEGTDLVHGEHILVADDPEVFADAVQSLYTDGEHWNQLSINGLTFARNTWGAEASWQAFKQILEDIGIHGINRGSRPLKLWSEQDHGDGLHDMDLSTAIELQVTSPRGYMTNAGKNELISHLNMLGEIAMHSITADASILEVSMVHVEALRPHMDGLSRELAGKRPIRLLEVAAYAHIMGYELQSSYDAEVVLTDISKDTLALGKWVASENYSEDVIARVHRLAIDYHHIPFEDDSFDIVLIASAIHHTWNWRVVLDEMIRVTGPGGMVVLYDEPCMREFCLYGFRTNRDYNLSEPERALFDMGLLQTFAEPYLGSYSEALFGMIENETIPLGRLIGRLEQHGKIESLNLQHVMGTFEKNIMKLRTSGVDQIRKDIEQGLIRGIEKISTIPDSAYPALPVPDDEELTAFSTRLANRIHDTLKHEDDDGKTSIELAKIFGAEIKVAMRKKGGLNLAMPGLGLDRFKNSDRDVREAYPEALNKLLSKGQNIAPNIQLDSDDVLHKFFPRNMWSIDSVTDGGPWFITPTEDKNLIRIGDVSRFNRVGISIRVFTGYRGHPYRLILLVNGRAVKYYDVYTENSLFFTHMADDTEVGLYLGIRVTPIPGVSPVDSNSLPSVRNVNIGAIFVLGLEADQSDDDILFPIITATNEREYHDGLAIGNSLELTEYPDDLIQTIHYKCVNVDGFCVPCESRVSFRINMNFSTEGHITDRLFHWSENIICPLCSLNSGQRLIAGLLKQRLRRYVNDRMTACIVEPTPALYQWLQDELEGCDLVCVGTGDNEKLMPDLSTLESGTIDLVVGPTLVGPTQVGNGLLELVGESRLNFGEILRVLKPGGLLLATFPEPSGQEESPIAEQHLDGAAESSNTPNLVGTASSELAWGCLDVLRDAGFEDVRVELYSSAGYGHLGTANTMLCATKPEARRGQSQG